MAKPIAKAGNILSGHTVTHSDGNCFAQKRGWPCLWGHNEGGFLEGNPFCCDRQGLDTISLTPHWKKTIFPAGFGVRTSAQIELERRIGYKASIAAGTKLLYSNSIKVKLRPRKRAPIVSDPCSLTLSDGTRTLLLDPLFAIWNKDGC